MQLTMEKDQIIMEKHLIFGAPLHYWFLPETFTGEAPRDPCPRDTGGGMSSSATGLLALAFLSKSSMVWN